MAGYVCCLSLILYAAFNGCSTYEEQIDVSFLGMSRQVDCTNSKVGNHHGLLWFQSAADGLKVAKGGSQLSSRVLAENYRTCHRFHPLHIQHYKKAIREIERDLKLRHFTNQSNRDQPLFLCSALGISYWPKIKLIASRPAEEYTPRYRQYHLTGERFSSLLITVIVFPMTSVSERATFYECGMDGQGRENVASKEWAESHDEDDEVVEDFFPFNISSEATGLFNIPFPPTTATSVNDRSVQSAYSVMVIVSALVLLVILVFGIYAIRNIHKNQDVMNPSPFAYSAVWSTSGSSLSASNGSLSLDVSINHDFHLDGYEVPYTVAQDLRLRKLEICRNRLIYVNALYDSETKLVFEAMIDNNYNATVYRKMKNRRLAVKSLRLNFTDQEAAAFRSEASVAVALSGCLQINQLLGVCFVGRPPCLVFEYMANGDMCNFLRQTSPDKYHFTWPVPVDLYQHDAREMPDTYLDSLTNSLRRNFYRLHFPRFLKHIACGMRYMAERGFIHRDLAARNCLVDEALNVKVSDFGMCLKVTDGSSFIVCDKDEPIPIQWSSPEVHLHRKFSQRSDVWSFGIVAWEVFSFSIRPFYLLSHSETAQALRTALENLEVDNLQFTMNTNPLGTLLERPDSTPEFFFSLMQQCLAYSPEKRPLFEELCQKITYSEQTEQI